MAGIAGAAAGPILASAFSVNIRRCEPGSLSPAISEGRTAFVSFEIIQIASAANAGSQNVRYSAHPSSSATRSLRSGPVRPTTWPRVAYGSARETGTANKNSDVRHPLGDRFFSSCSTRRGTANSTLPVMLAMPAAASARTTGFRCERQLVSMGNAAVPLVPSRARIAKTAGPNLIDHSSPASSISNSRGSAANAPGPAARNALIAFPGPP